MDSEFIITTPILSLGLSMVLSILWIVVFAGVSSSRSDR